MLVSGGDNSESRVFVITTSRAVALEADIGEFALGRRVLALQVAALASLAAGQIARALGLVGVTLAAGSLSPLAQCACLRVAVRGRCPRY